MSKQKLPRLKKNPQIARYVVEETFYTTGIRTNYQYFSLSSQAKSFAKKSQANRVRVFHQSFDLVSDRKE